MNCKVIVEDISWKGPKLVFCLNVIPKEDIYLTDGKRKYKCIKKNNNCIMCLTNVGQDKMLNGKNWYLELEEQMVEVSSSCVNKLEDCGRVFKYGLGYYAYIIDFHILERNGKMYLMIDATFYKYNKHPEKRDIQCESSSLFSYILKLSKVMIEQSIQIIYVLFSMVRKKNGVLLMSETRTPISGNLKALDDRLKERNVEEKILYYFDKTLDHKKIYIYFHWVLLCWKIAGSKLIFIDDYAPIFKYLTLRRKTTLIQLWHAGIGFKAVGYARFGKEGSPYPYQSGHRKYDYVVVGSERLIPIYSEVFGIPKDRFLPYGLPRLDDYLNQKKIDIYRYSFYLKFPQLKNRKIILFAPTYRGSTQDKAFYPYDKLDYSLIKAWIEQGYAFLVKMHPFVKEKIKIPQSMATYFIDVSKEEDINELFYITDILITDYSSNIYEFSLFNKPIIFFAYDYEEYRILRGMQNRLEELNFGVIALNFKEINSAIMNEEYHMEGLSSYIKQVHNNSGQRSCDQIIAKFMHK